MQAIILAAGRGTRFGGNSPKALLEINGKTLIARLLEQLRDLGIGDITVMTGYKKVSLEKAVGPYNVRTVENPLYSYCDNLVSFWFGSKEIEHDCLVIHGDVIAEDELFRKILDSSGDVVLPYDSLSVNEEAMKIKLDGDRITGLSKTLSLNEASGESIPVMKFSEPALRLLKEIVNAAMLNGQLQRLLDSAVLELIQSGQVDCQALDVSGCKWFEIDTPADWVKAGEIFRS